MPSHPRSRSGNAPGPAPGDGQRVLSQPRRGNQEAVGSFPSRVRVPLRYTSYLRVNPGVVTGADTVFSLNGIFDPEVSGAGHQPREYDTWAALYGKYKVHSCLVDASVRQRASHGISCHLIPTNSATALTSAAIPQELPRTVRLGITGSNQPVAHKVVAFDNAAVLGLTKAQYMANEDTAGAIGANPTEQTYLHLWAQQLDSATPCDFEFEVILTYDVEFYDRVYTGPSAFVDGVRSLSGAREAAVADPQGWVPVPTQGSGRFPAPAPPHARAPPGR